MGVRIFNEGRHYSPKVPTFKGSLGVWKGAPSGGLTGRRSPTPRQTLLFDGTTGKEGLAAALPANEAWLDPTCLLELGATQMSMTAVYGGAGTCKVYGAMLPSDYAVKVEGADGAALVTEAATRWEELYTLAPNVAANLMIHPTGGDAIIYTLYRFEFLANNVPGSVVVSAM
jgi:hypothetical protein